MLLHALYERLCTAPLNRLPCYGDIIIIIKAHDRADPNLYTFQRLHGRRRRRQYSISCGVDAADADRVRLVIQRQVVVAAVCGCDIGGAEDRRDQLKRTAWRVLGINCLLRRRRRRRTGSSRNELH